LAVRDGRIEFSVCFTSRVERVWLPRHL
jgi:hypothetical protein